MRAIIRDVYQGQKWYDKVDAMKPNQVIAVYMSFKKRGLVA